MKEESLLPYSSLINLFALFCLGTLGAFLHYFSIVYNWQNSWNGSVFSLLFLLSYEVVFISLLLYYFSRNKKKLSHHIIKNKNKYIMFILILAVITYGFLGYWKEKYWPDFWEKLIYGVIILFGVPFVKSLLEKIPKRE